MTVSTFLLTALFSRLILGLSKLVSKIHKTSFSDFFKACLNSFGFFCANSSACLIRFFSDVFCSL